MDWFLSKVAFPQASRMQYRYSISWMQRHFDRRKKRAIKSQSSAT